MVLTSELLLQLPSLFLKSIKRKRKRNTGLLCRVLSSMFKALDWITNTQSKTTKPWYLPSSWYFVILPNAASQAGDTSGLGGSNKRMISMRMSQDLWDWRGWNKMQCINCIRFQIESLEQITSSFDVGWILSIENSFFCQWKCCDYINRLLLCAVKW